MRQYGCQQPDSVVQGFDDTEETDHVQSPSIHPDCVCQVVDDAVDDILSAKEFRINIVYIPGGGVNRLVAYQWVVRRAPCQLPFGDELSSPNGLIQDSQHSQNDS